MNILITILLVRFLIALIADQWRAKKKKNKISASQDATRKILHPAEFDLR